MDTRQMIDECVKRCNGRFKLTVLLQKRIQELNQGAQKLVDVEGASLMEIALHEIIAGKISLAPDEEPKLAP